MSKLEEYYYYEDRVLTPATHCYRVYHADEVDTVIAHQKYKLEEQESLIKELKAKLETVKHALWLSRARTANCEMQLFVKESADPRTTAEEADRSERMALKWSIVGLKCRKKAKEYK